MRETNALESILLELSSLPSPKDMAKSGAPPSPIRYANDVMSVDMGAQTPTPASTVPPMSCIFPTYILSTTEYSTLMN